MDPRDTEYVKRFDEALRNWTDERFVSRDQIRDLAMFNLYLVNLAEADGWDYYGHSWKQGRVMGCLVVKATVEGAPYVAFTSARNITNGIGIFLRKMRGDAVEWVPDRFRQ